MIRGDGGDGGGGDGCGGGGGGVVVVEQNKSMVETDEGQTKLKQARRSFKKSVKIRPDDEAQNYLQQIEKLLN